MREMQVTELDKAQLAFYKGPANGIWHKVTHGATCYWTQGRYSHVELIIDGVCYSSSGRDGGVRKKVIPSINTSGRWDVYDVLIDKEFALQFFQSQEGALYDWAGVARHVVPCIPESETRWYCSELIAAMMGTTDDNLTPYDLFANEVLTKYKRYVETSQPKPSTWE